MFKTLRLPFSGMTYLKVLVFGLEIGISELFGIYYLELVISQLVAGIEGKEL